MSYHGTKYNKLINCKRWRDLRNAILSSSPLCQRCLESGLYKAAQVVHHIQPVESARTEEEMRALAYSPGNLQPLCFDCHAIVHRELAQKTTAALKARKIERVNRALDTLFGDDSKNARG